MRTLMLCAAIFAAGCSKSSASSGSGSGSASAASAPAKPGEARKVAIEAGSKGFVPDTIEGKPGEKLDLVFTRTVDGDCMSQVKFEGQKPIELPKDQAVSVPITVPPTGKMQFTCAMDMNTGVIVPRS